VTVIVITNEQRFTWMACGVLRLATHDATYGNLIMRFTHNGLLEASGRREFD